MHSLQVPGFVLGSKNSFSRHVVVFVYFLNTQDKPQCYVDKGFEKLTRDL